MSRTDLFKLMAALLKQGMEFAADAAAKSEAKWDDAAVAIAKQAIDLLLPLVGQEPGAEAVPAEYVRAAHAVAAELNAAGVDLAA